MQRLWQAFFAGVLDHHGSTRAVGLLRIACGLLLWTRFARDVMPFRDLDPDRLLLSVCFYVFSTMMVFGLFTRVAMVGISAVLGAMVLWFGHTQGVEPWTHHHTTLHMLSTWWLAFTPCGKSFSLDRYLAVRRARAAGVAPPPEWGALWGTRLIGLQLGALYFWSALDKIEQHMWTGERLQHLVMHYYTGSFLPDGLWFTVPMALAGTYVIALELVLPWGMWVHRLRPWLILQGFVLHGLFYVLIPVNTFSVLTVTLYLAYVPPEQVDRVLDLLMGRDPTPSGSSAAPG